MNWFFDPGFWADAFTFLMLVGLILSPIGYQFAQWVKR